VFQFKYGTWKLPPATLAIALLPLAVISVSMGMLSGFGMPGPAATLHPIQNVYVEAAARLRMLATWIVLATLGIGSIGYFLCDLRKFEQKSARWLLVAFLLAAGIPAILTSTDSKFGRAEHSIGEATICMAFGGKAPATQSQPQKQRPGAATAPQPKAAALDAPECAGVGNFDTMKRLNRLQLYILLLVLPTMVLGAISALAMERPTSEQGARLKTYLYLAATLFVCGLLYLSALLRWPGAALTGQEATNYNAFVDGYLLCLGAAYSLFIISYYLPVVIALSSDGNAVAAVAARDPKAAADGVLKPLDILKVVLALFAPVIAALLGNVIKI
jgi:hypothetical protein